MVLGEKDMSRRDQTRMSIFDLSSALKNKLGRERIAITVTAETVDMRSGRLAVILTLSSSQDSVSQDQKQRAERIANEECIKYLQE